MAGEKQTVNFIEQMLKFLTMKCGKKSIHISNKSLFRTRWLHATDRFVQCTADNGNKRVQLLCIVEHEPLGGGLLTQHE
jgi:hypothetical protein